MGLKELNLLGLLGSIVPCSVGAVRVCQRLNFVVGGPHGASPCQRRIPSTGSRRRLRNPARRRRTEVETAHSESTNLVLAKPLDGAWCIQAPLEQTQSAREAPDFPALGGTRERNLPRPVMDQADRTVAAGRALGTTSGLCGVSHILNVPWKLSGVFGSAEHEKAKGKAHLHGDR